MNSEFILLFAKSCMDYTMPNGADSVKYYNDNADEFLSLLALNLRDYTDSASEMLHDTMAKHNDYLRKHWNSARLWNYATPMVRHLFVEIATSEYMGRITKAMDGQNISVAMAQLLANDIEYAAGREYFPAALKQKELLERLVIADWLASKQVFSISSELTTALMSCVSDDKGIEFYLKTFDYLPFKSFYVALDNVPDDINSMGFSGVLVGVRKFSFDHVWLYAGFVDNTGKVVNNWAADFADELLRNGNSLDVPVDLCLYDKRGLPSEKICYFVMSVIMYLSSDKPDVVESSKTKSTYRESSKAYRVKNKFRELRGWEVGVRYAESIKKTTECAETKKFPQKEGSPKRPHIRRAHWHHYWVGRGRTELVLRWVDQMMINSTGWDSELPAVVHCE